MENTPNIFHLRSGDQVSAAIVDTWVELRGLASIPTDDVFAACTHLLRNQSSPPELVFVGTDWLSQDDLVILEFIRQAWPEVGMVVYGTNQKFCTQCLPNFAIYCESRKALNVLLDASPEMVIQTLRRTEKCRPQRVRVLRPTGTASDRGETPVVQAATATKERVAVDVDEAALATATVDLANYGIQFQAASAPRASLTAEELEALLGDG